MSDLIPKPSKLLAFNVKSYYTVNLIVKLVWIINTTEFCFKPTNHIFLRQ